MQKKKTSRNTFLRQKSSIGNIPLGSMGRVYLHTQMVDLYGKLVGKYTIHGSYGYGYVSKFRKPPKPISYQNKQFPGDFLEVSRFFFETYMNKIKNTSFSSALKKAASRARIKEGRTACKQTLRSWYTFVLSGCNRGKWRSLCKWFFVKSEKCVEICKIFKVLNCLNSPDFRISGILMYITWRNEIVPKDLSIMYICIQLKAKKTVLYI